MCVLNLFYYVYANAFCHLLIKQILNDCYRKHISKGKQ